MWNFDRLWTDLGLFRKTRGECYITYAIFNISVLLKSVIVTRLIAGL